MKHAAKLIRWIIHCYTFLFGMAVIATASFSMGTQIVFRRDVENDLFDYVKLPFPQYLVLIIVLLAILIAVCGMRKIPDCRTLRPLLVLTVTTFCLFLILAVKPKATNDALLLEEVMDRFAAGDYSDLTMNHYLNIYPFQLFYAVCGTALAKVAGPHNYFVSQLINTACILAILAFLEGITRELFASERVTQVCVLLSFTLLPLFVYCTFVYSDIPSFALQMGALYFEILYLRREKPIFLLPAGIFIAAAILLKNNCYIALIAMDAMLVFTPFGDEAASGKGRKRKSGPHARHDSLLFNLFAAVLITACCVVPGRLLQEHYASKAGLETPPDGVPAMAYISMGVQEAEGKYGWYNGYNVHVYGLNDSNGAAATEAAFRDWQGRMKEFAENPKYGVKFFLLKFLSQWGDSSGVSMREIEEAGRNNEPLTDLAQNILFGPFRGAMEFLMQVFHSILLIGCVLYLFFLLFGKQTKLSEGEALLIMFIFGGMLFHLLWEASGRYTLRYVIHLLPLASCGIVRASDWAFAKKKASRR